MMPSRLSFSIYFDGTACSIVDDPDSTLTNVGILYKAQNAHGTDLSYNNGIADKYGDRVDRTSFSGEPEKIYFDGVGSNKDGFFRTLQCVTGQGGSQRIEDAYDATVTFHNKYAFEKVDINVLGFSRGAAQARAFCNMTIKNGVPKLDRNSQKTGEYLIPPGDVEINKLAIFDTVASYGLPISDFHPGKDLQIHPNVKSTTHLIALNEYRKTFKLTSALRRDDNSNIEEIGFPGAHSQVGGGYRGDILSAGPLSLMYEKLKDAGMKMDWLSLEDQKRILQYNEIIVSPGRVAEHLIDSRIVVKNGHKTTFPLEKGWIDFFNKQENDFDHKVFGRSVIYEYDNFLARDFTLDDAFAYELVMENYNKHGRKYPEHRSLEDEKKNTAGKLSSAINQFETAQSLDKAMGTSIPTMEYIASLNFKPVPVATPNIDFPDTDIKIAEKPVPVSLASSLLNTNQNSGNLFEANQYAIEQQDKKGKLNQWRKSKNNIILDVVDDPEDDSPTGVYGIHQPFLEKMTQ